MLVSHGSPIFGVRFCDTGVGVARDAMAIKFWALAFSCSSTGLKQEFQHSSLCLPVYFICSPFLCLGGLRVGVQFLFPGILLVQTPSPPPTDPKFPGQPTNNLPLNPESPRC